jgi:DNA recombination protein Rad52
MSFSTTQIRKLQQALHPKRIRTREMNGRQMHYIEGWHAIAEANRIFGFDAWNRETVESRCVLSRESKGSFHIVYIAKVRITVRTSQLTIIREGYGTGEAQAPSAGEAHDKAIKTAETDASKRALATFGKPFGLSLYLGTRRSDNPTIQPSAPIERRRTLQRLGPNGRYHVVPYKAPALDPEAIRRPERREDEALPSSPGPATSGASTHTTAALANAQGQNDDPAESNPSPANSTGEPAAFQNSEPIPEAPIANSVTLDPMLIVRSKRHRDANHLRFIANQPCLVCSRTPCDAHHLKFAQPHALSKKVSDEFTVPLCRIHHRQLHHGGNEVNWWIDMDIDPLPIAKELWEKSKTRTEP